LKRAACGTEADEMTKFNPRQDLLKLVEGLLLHIEEHEPQETSIPRDIARRFSKAALEFLDGKQNSLDHALGLISKKGKRQKPELFNLAVAAYERRERNASKLKPTWLQISEELDTVERYDLDEKELKNLVARSKPSIESHFVKVDARAVVDRLTARNPQRRNRRIV
jgi:hypothetical protein